MYLIYKDQNYLNDSDYIAAHRDILETLEAYYEAFYEDKLIRYAAFIKNEIIPPFKRHDILITLNAWQRFDKYYNTFDQYAILIVKDIETLYSLQLKLDSRYN